MSVGGTGNGDVAVVGEVYQFRQTASEEKPDLALPGAHRQDSGINPERYCCCCRCRCLP